jgi:hypothetical protein
MVVFMCDISLGLTVTVAWLWAMVLEGRARQVRAEGWFWRARRCRSPQLPGRRIQR